MDRPEGHCKDDRDWETLTNSPVYQGDRSLLLMGDKTDFQLANDQFMVNRDSLDLISHQTAAKERIRWLSIQLAKALAIIEEKNACIKHWENGHGIDY